MIKCLIIDDEPLARQLLLSYAQQMPTLEVIACCGTALEAFEILHQKEIDLLFLDIQMPGINGLNFLKSLKNPPKVIFTTAYMEHAIEAFELDAIDYLLKPITLERFIKSVQKLTAKKETTTTTNHVQEEAIFIKVDKRLVRLEHQQILYIESQGDYIKVVTPAQNFITYSTISKISEWLPANQFIRIHKSYMINLRHIDFIEANYVSVAKNQLPIGITYKDALLQKITQR